MNRATAHHGLSGFNLIPGLSHPKLAPFDMKPVHDHSEAEI